MERWVLYVDMDAYYVACEIRDRPELVGQKVIVGPNPHLGPSRGVVLSASYEARKDGVRSAMPVAQADRLSPGALWISPDFPKYERVANEIREFLRARSPEVLPLSIDEAAVRRSFADAADAEAAARALQRDLKQELRLSASVGVSPSRIVAKIASERAKPGGVVVVPSDTIAEFLDPLPVRSIPGVGPKTERALLAVEVRTVGDLRRASPERLRKAVGGFAVDLRLLAEGHPVESEDFTSSPPKSRSTDHTFASDVTSLEELLRAGDEMVGQLSEGIQHEGLRYQRVTVGFRWSDFSRTQIGRSFPAAQAGREPLASAVPRLIRDGWAAESHGQGRAVRTLSVRVERLSGPVGANRSLESFEEDRPSSREIK